MTSLNLKPKRPVLKGFHLEGIESFLMFGSNLGDRYEFLRRGFDMVTNLSKVKLLRTSRIYETEPVGVTDQPRFLNNATCILTSLSPYELLGKIKEIEKEIGRLPRGRWREREIDIDIIFYGDEKIHTKELTLPHPEAHLRRFVLEPLNEIAPNYLHPVFRKTIHQLLLECEDNSSVAIVNEPLLSAI